MIKKTKSTACRGALQTFLNQNQQKRRYLGTHIVAEFWNYKNIESILHLKKILYTAAKKSNNRVLKFSYHKFKPQGFTAILLLAESHIALHSWPEFNYLAVDLFTCGQNNDPRKALDFLKKQFRPKKVQVKIVKRGKL